MKTPSRNRSTVATIVLASIAAIGAPASGQPQGRGGGPPASGDQSPTIVPFVDPSTLVRDMARQQVTTAAGQAEQKVVVPARYCAGLVAGGSKSVTLPAIRWGVRTTTPVAATRRTTLTLQWPAQQKKDEVLPDGMPGSSERSFTFARPAPRSIRVTLLPVAIGNLRQIGLGDGSVRSIGDSGQTVSQFSTSSGARPLPAPTSNPGSVTDGTSNTVVVGETTRPGARPTATVCVSDVFVQDPPIEVRVNVAGPPGAQPAERKTTF